MHEAITLTTRLQITTLYIHPPHKSRVNNTRRPQQKPAYRSLLAAIDISKAFDTVPRHLINKMLNTIHPNKKKIKHLTSRPQHQNPCQITNNTQKSLTQNWKNRQRHPVPHSHYFRTLQGRHYNNIQTVHQTNTNIRTHSVAAWHCKNTHNLQTTQNTAFRIATNCTKSTSPPHLHEET